MGTLVPRSVLHACAVLCVLAGIASAGDLHVIIGFKGDVDAGVAKKHGAKPGRSIGGLRAVRARVPAAAVARLRADPAVAYVEEDGYVFVAKRPADKGPKNGGGGDPPPEERPWGIDRVGGGLTGNTGAGIKVAVVDTGIDSDHSDLAANFKGGVDFTRSRNGYEDEHGHGSHVAGTVAAVDNDIGVIGVAPQAHLYAVRVLHRRGSGRWSDVADGITWTADNNMQIANMSIGGGHSTTVQNACIYAEGAGVLLVASSGNGGDGNISTTEWNYPAAYGEVVSVAATSSTDGLAGFSNSGPHVEVAAPGVGVASTYKNNGYKTWNGTSMACPHAVGVAALIWAELGATTNDAVRFQLQSRVDDPAPTGRDNGYGYGIVDYSN
jgi:subtilisin family serine protease